MRAIKIVFAYFLGVLRKLAQHFVSFIFLVRSNVSTPIRFDLPVQFRGDPKKLFLGPGSRINSGVFINCNGKIHSQSKTFFNLNVIINVGSKANLLIGKSFNVDSNTIISVKKEEWLIGNNVSIAKNCMLFAREKESEGVFKIGDNSNISDNTIIDLCDSVLIGNDVAIGNNCTLFTHNHVYSDKTKPAWKGGIKKGSIIIHDGAWIGANVTIMPGIEIGARAVVAAGSIVTKSFPSEQVVAGVPAKIIKSI